ncbi:MULTISPECIES: EAL domain-containing protein [unclassified Rhizobium]|uniref:bifunctional diguanylate cyclase/phosphodiesterase n=1 Tax=unclassified Rhizobium TaxID=2613769 RepID=UPI001AE3C7AB|nr:MULTISPECIES: EAL domain-containing protein [unclassified Rhizobium]MBP2461722.1 diguanylate cyclase (GGDEF)-like protein [Rhizobium sp. PvP014]MBP2529118.1 diguanylate cyclase (GGDEF)-like protein [Rhizobium sp. PvP099]
MLFSSSMIKPGRSRERRFYRFGWYLPAFIMVAAVIFGIVRADLEERAQYMAQQRLVASEQLARVSSSLETNIRGNVNLVQGLVAAIASNPSITQTQFAALSERVFAVPSQLKNVAVAPNLVIRYVYPYDQNKQLVGRDYTADPKRSVSVMEAIKRRSTTIAGPVELAQGGLGLLARYPVFSQANGHFWGIVSSVIDVERLFRDIDLDTERQPLSIAISRRPAPVAKDVFTGDPAIFSADAVRARIELGYDTWYLAAVPKAGWNTTPPDIGWLYAYATLIALCIVAPMIWVGILMRQRNRHIVDLQHREEQFETIHHRLTLALEASQIGVWEYEGATDRLFWDERLKDLYSAPPGKDIFTYEDWRSTVHPDDIETAENRLNEVIGATEPYITQFRIVRPSGEIRHIRAHGKAYKTSGGVERVVGANWDVTDDVNLQIELREERARAEEQNERLRATRRTLQHQSLHDALTGLPNRRFLDQFMEASNATTHSHRLAFIHFDLDRFKEVNDTLGHAAGDEVLRQTTARLLELIGHDEFVSRIGGDEFVVVTSGPAPEERAKHLGRSIVKAIAKPMTIDGQECHVGCSAGIAMQTLACEEPRQLLINADVALYEAKKRGRNRAEVFSESLLLTAIQVKRTSDELLAAIENDQIVPFFQPQFDAVTLDIVGVEALARWVHPTRGLLAPEAFLDIAEGLHRSGEIDALILEKALFQATRWRARGLAVPRVSVNVSAQRLKDENLLEQLSHLSFAPGSIAFELLESISFEGNDRGLRKIIGTLKDLGIDIELDDFGSGHASIVSLLELGPKRLKIDRQLISPLQASGPQHRLVASIIEIGRSQGIEIVAEGVETEAHMDILRGLGCQVLQGYAFAEPMSPDAFMDFAAHWQQGRVPATAVPTRKLA